MSNTVSTEDKGGPPPRWILKTMTRLHVLLHRMSAGRLFNTLAGDEVCFVDMTGARSGRTLTIPLMYVPHGRGLLLVASMAGAPKNPTWHHNLVKNPDIEITYRSDRKKFRSRLATTEEKSGLWPVCDQHYAPFADYRKRTARDIPIFVCDPVSDGFST